MPQFKYKARDQNGNLAVGVLEGESVEQAARRLLTRGLYPSTINKRFTGSFKNIAPLRALFAPPIGLEEKITLTSRFSILLKAGVTVNSSLSSLIEQTEEPALKNVLEDVKKRVEEGASLSEAMAGHQSVFNEVYTSIVAAGELSGSLDTCLKRLGALLEWERNAKEKAKEAMRYPKIVLAGAVVASIVLLWMVLPRYAAIFERVNMPMPLLTQIMIGAGNFFQQFWMTGILIFCGGYIIFRLWTSADSGRLKFDDLILKTPIIGDLVTSLCVASWANVLANLISSGVPIIQSLKMSARAIGNSSFSLKVNKIAEDVSEGVGLTEPIRRHGLAPAPAPQMIAAGEQSGALDDMLFQVGKVFEYEADRKIKKLGAYLEPVLIVGLSFLVLFLALAVFLPMWDMTRLARTG